MEYVTRKEFEALEKRVAKLEASESIKQKVHRLQTPAEFLLEKQPKNFIDKVVCLIYFLEEKENFGEDVSVSSNDVSTVFGKAREKKPKNVSDALSKCAGKGWISEVSQKGKKKLWRLTNTGVQYVEGLGSES